ncbi:PE family protein, partial [Mycobacterium tuberculosis]
STALATLFGAYGQQFQAISAQVAAFHNEFSPLVWTCTSSGSSLGIDL